jgi:hypothetical protein
MLIGVRDSGAGASEESRAGELSNVAGGFVDGQYLPHLSAALHIEDRGYEFGSPGMSPRATMPSRRPLSPCLS